MKTKQAMRLRKEKKKKLIDFIFRLGKIRKKEKIIWPELIY